MTKFVGGVSRLMRARSYVLFLVVAASVAAVASKYFVYGDLSWNRDEPVYLWQADLLRSGQLTSTDGGYPTLFHPWLSAHRDGRFFSQYPLGWPAALAVGGAIGWQASTLVVASVLAVLGAYALVAVATGRREIAAMTATLFVCSPIFAVQSGAFLTYLFATGLGCLFAAALLLGVRRGSWKLVAAAGGFLGLLVVTRTYDAVVWAVAVGGYVLVVDRSRWRELVRLLVPFVGAVAPFVALQLLHNWLTTGHPTQFAITVADPLDRFGFGPRRLMPRLDTVDYTLGRAVRGTLKHIFFLPWFLFGAHMGLGLALLGAWWERRRPGTGLLVTIALAFPLAYFPFWGIEISSLTTRISGPIYYIPTFVPIAALLSFGLAGIARRRRSIAVSAVTVMLVVTLPIGVGRLGLNRHLSRVQAAWSEAADRIPDGSVVAVSPSPYLLYLAPEAITRPDVPGRLVYVTDASADLVDFVDRADRDAYVLRPKVPAGELAPSEHTKSFDVESVPLEVIQGSELELEIRTVAPMSGHLAVDISSGPDLLWSAPPRTVSKGDVSRTSARLVSTGPAAGSHDVVVGNGPIVLDVTVGVGASPAAARAEPSYMYRLLVDGGRTVRALSVGRIHRPLEKYLAKGELRWAEDVPSAELKVTVRTADRDAD